MLSSAFLSNKGGGSEQKYGNCLNKKIKTFSISIVLIVLVIIMRKTSVFIPIGSMTSLHRGESHRMEESDSDISNLSFKHWHKHMQNEHERLALAGESSSFRMWKWCYKVCLPCRWFDSIEYEKKICKCCLRFRTFKTLGTTILISVFCYIFLYSLLKDEVLPGGSVFFILFLFITAYLAGYVAMLLGMPPMIGHLLVGITFGNLPQNWLPPRDNDYIEYFAKYSEKVLLIIALIRAGLLLDLPRIKNHILFIFRISSLPFICEFILVFVSAHFFMELPLEWSALQGSVMSVVSLASVTSVMEKNKKSGYGEDKHLCTVLIAASALNVIMGLLAFTVCISEVFKAKGFIEDKSEQMYLWYIMWQMAIEALAGFAAGLAAGLLCAFFPDKRNSEAASIRIVEIGIGSFAVASVFNELFFMPVAGTIACLTLCIVAINMWEELGWHQDNNPVLYFYTAAYYLAQPVVLSLVGFTMDFTESEGRWIGLSIAVLLVGLAGKETVCFAVLCGKSYPTTFKEKIFICIAWLSKGTFQALLAFSITYFVEHSKSHFEESTYQTMLEYSLRIKETTILAILLTTPIACYCLTLLTPKLLTKFEPDGNEAQQGKKHRGSIRFQTTVGPSKKKSLKKTSVVLESVSGPG